MYIFNYEASLLHILMSIKDCIYMQVFNKIYHLHDLKFAYGVQINRTFTKHFTGRQFQGEIRNRDTSDKNKRSAR